MKTTPKDFFLNLGIIVTLYLGVIALLNLAFTIIDSAFPRTSQYEYFGNSSISWAVAALIILFPLFVLLSWLSGKEYLSNPEKKSLGVRKWLLFITLFVAGGVVAGDLIVLLYTFLNGELITAGFILKVLAVFVVAGAVFSYYISDIRNTTSRNRNKIYAWLIAVVLLVLIITGFSLTGSPRTQRMLKIDSQKVADLQNIQWQIVHYWQQKQTLPTTLANLNDPIGGFVVPQDPDTGMDYEYRVIKNSAPAQFVLCSDFNRQSRNDNRMSVAKDSMGENWNHEEGRTCFERTIDPELYPPRTNPSAF